MDIKAFLNPKEEAVQDTPDDIESQVLAQYMPEIEEDSEELINLRRAGYLSKSVY